MTNGINHRAAARARLRDQSAFVLAAIDESLSQLERELANPQPGTDLRKTRQLIDRLEARRRRTASFSARIGS